jgi:hypothetical protein
LRIVRKLREIGRHFFARSPCPFDQFTGETREPRRIGDQARLFFDLLGIEIVFGTRNAPAAPVRISCDDDRVSSRNGMSGAIRRRLPFVAGTDDSPVTPLALMAVLWAMLRLKFVGRKFAPQTDVVKNPEGLVQALGPVRNHALYQSPRADGPYVDSLVLVKLRFSHLRTAHATLGEGKPWPLSEG